MRPAIMLLALLLTACGSETPVRTSAAGGDPGTKPAPTATATASPAATATPTATATAPAPALKSASFRTPTGRLACTIVEDALVCDVRPQAGDKGFPKPDTHISPECQEVAASEWGNGVSLPRAAEAFPNCSTDVRVPDSDPPTLAYGRTYERDGFTCRSESKGLTCTRGDHGFFANRDVIETH
ncbi:MAG TPA: DUF6636 domain-containing protein [Solirubrobacter sp.]